MSEELNLVRDLAVILIAAGTFTIISRALKQPLILGYIVAGFLVGPHVSFFPGISSAESVSQWSEIGIIFLLFALGLEFSFKKLLKVGAGALIMAGCQCVGMMSIGVLVGRAMEWSTMESIFLGGMLSMSSTAIIIKAYDDMGLKSKPYAPTVFGTLVVQDLLAILLMVLLSTMAVSNQFSGGEMVLGIAKLVFFLILWFLVGIFVIPTLFEKAHRYLNDEILLIVGIGLCFGMVSLASLAGFSSALGAFVMGSILAETVEGERIGQLVGSLKNLFAAIFFVSVGMMVDPSVIGEHWLTILIITVVAMGGITIFATSGALLAGKGLDNSVHCGFSLAQLGEFSFILAGLGVSLGVMRDFIYPVIITVSVITTFTTPYMIKAADPVSRWLQKVLPEGLQSRLSPSQEVRPGSAAEQSEWKKLIKGQALRVVLYSVVLVAVLLCSKLYLDALLGRIFPSMGITVKHIICVVATLLVMAPFLLAMVSNSASANTAAAKLLAQSQANALPLVAVSVLKMAVAMMFILMAIASHFHLTAFRVVVIVAFAVLAFYFCIKYSLHHFTMLEKRFMKNLRHKEESDRRKAPVTASVSDKLAGYDVHLELVTVSSDSAHAGLRLKQIPFRSETGVNILKIQRGSRSIIIPAGDEVVFPGDKMLAVGTTQQIAAFREMMLKDSMAPAERQEADFKVDSVVVAAGGSLDGKTLRELDMRSARCMVISVMRGDSIITNPKPDFHFAPGDIVWIAGESSSVAWFGEA